MAAQDTATWGGEVTSHVGFLGDLIVPKLIAICNQQQKPLLSVHFILCFLVTMTYLVLKGSPYSSGYSGTQHLTSERSSFPTSSCLSLTSAWMADVDHHPWLLIHCSKAHTLIICSSVRLSIFPLLFFLNALNHLVSAFCPCLLSSSSSHLKYLYHSVSSLFLILRHQQCLHLPCSKGCQQPQSTLNDQH